MKHPTSTARPSELGGHRSMLLEATSRHCAQPPAPTVSTHCAMAYTPAPAAIATSRGKRGTAIARSLTSACTAPLKAPPATVEPLQICLLPGPVVSLKKGKLSYPTMQPSRMARPPVAAPQAGWTRAARRGGVEAGDAVSPGDVWAALRQRERRRYDARLKHGGEAAAGGEVSAEFGKGGVKGREEGGRGRDVVEAAPLAEQHSLRVSGCERNQRGGDRQH